MDYKNLASAAIEIKERAYAPYSNFLVGAALLTKDGRIFTGCNIETAALSGICAERTAIYTAISEGVRDFAAIAVTGNPRGSDARYCYPCGVCRQAMMEFFPPDTDVIIVKTPDDYKVHKFSELLPYGFGPGDLG